MKKIHALNRAQLIDDSFSLANVGKLTYTLVFELMSYLKEEHEYEPWYAAARSLKYVGRLLEVNGENEAVKNLEVSILVVFSPPNF